MIAHAELELVEQIAFRTGLTTDFLMGTKFGDRGLFFTVDEAKGLWTLLKNEYIPFDNIPGTQAVRKIRRFLDELSSGDSETT